MPEAGKLVTFFTFGRMICTVALNDFIPREPSAGKELPGLVGGVAGLTLCASGHPAKAPGFAHQVPKGLFITSKKLFGM